MAKLIFYRQKRYDGGVRTGLELDGDPIGERFEGGEGERDPALIWYVDLRCEGPGIPDDPDLAEQWLFDHAPIIRDGFLRLAERLRAGTDKDIYSLKWSDFPDAPEGVSMTIACSAVRRVDGREISAVLKDIASHWEDILQTIEVPEGAEG
ncbi:MAG TPA: hypothetical protein VFF52_29625 [Isosphaeraceae bacterium]|nr:hypothetical protein [Isosphaeraceae bacterium]